MWTKYVAMAQIIYCHAKSWIFVHLQRKTVERVEEGVSYPKRRSRRFDQYRCPLSQSACGLTACQHNKGAIDKYRLGVMA